ncbi:hypothetical protein BRADI_2g46160v3 [Brachypodium distachyon]|uniref:Uncharacterized protein n=1 Tax=Brachypodium distachyon TaxID=15368 RepID=I1HQ87_BRADI|nr:hypothetical protein BRADI_2g46160v3 [Brachypodium distachyon]
MVSRTSRCPRSWASARGALRGLPALGAEVHVLPAPARVQERREARPGADAAAAVHKASEWVVVPMSTSSRYPSYYYLNLDGISIGERQGHVLQEEQDQRTMPGPAGALESPVSGSADGDSSGMGPDAYGMIIDIASTITFLEESLYEEMVGDLEEEIRLPRGSGSDLGRDLCFILPEGVPMSRVYAPPVSLAFEGEWLRLDKEKMFVE